MPGLTNLAAVSAVVQIIKQKEAGFVSRLTKKLDAIISAQVRPAGQCAGNYC
jgi:hypothetical protein